MTPTEAQSLLPCPFCGGAAKIIRTGSIGDRYIRVQCVSCGTSVGETRITLECINAWNHRTPPSSALGEEIRKLATELREKAMKATPGPWHSFSGNHICSLSTKPTAYGICDVYVGNENSSNNQVHIAACDPPTIIKIMNYVLGEGDTDALENPTTDPVNQPENIR